MPLTKCPDCQNDISDAAPSCPHCGRPNATQNNPSSSTKISALLGVGIFFIPLIFSWFTLRKGYSSTSRAVAFSWLVCTLLVIMADDAPPTSGRSQAEAQAPSKAVSQTAKPEPKNDTPDDSCREDLQCWGDKHSMDASLMCKKVVDRMAKYSVKWTDGIFEPKFSHFRWADKESAVVTYMGDKVQFQNGFGAYQNYVYECDYAPEEKTILDVRLEPGRI